VERRTPRPGEHRRRARRRSHMVRLAATAVVGPVHKERKARARWVEDVTAAYPPGSLEDGGPIRTARTGAGSTHVPTRTPFGGYDLATGHEEAAMSELSRVHVNLLAVLSVHGHDVHGPALAYQLRAPVTCVHRSLACTAPLPRSGSAAWSPRASTARASPPHHRRPPSRPHHRPTAGHRLSYTSGCSDSGICRPGGRPTASTFSKSSRPARTPSRSARARPRAPRRSSIGLSASTR
jgi:hypothetical protein